GDHAAKEETSFGLALLPEFVDPSLLVDGRDPKDHWPDGDDSVAKTIYPGVCTDVGKACFSQLGVDARQASAEHGWASLSPVFDELARRIQAHLA
ncbi:MAG: creatininase family protein, partial [Phycisphaeraceae bacterium]|nr:creatininase family protein [Phycisphaeraceae bacterium]